MVDDDDGDTLLVELDCDDVSDTRLDIPDDDRENSDDGLLKPADTKEDNDDDLADDTGDVPLEPLDVFEDDDDLPDDCGDLLGNDGIWRQ